MISRAINWNVLSICYVFNCMLIFMCIFSSLRFERCRLMVSLPHTDSKPVENYTGESVEIKIEIVL